MDLADYLLDRYSNGLRYVDAANACLLLFVADIVLPVELSPPARTRQEIAAAFAALAERGGVHPRDEREEFEFGRNPHALDEEAHWSTVIDSVYDLDLKKVDFRRGMDLLGAKPRGRGELAT